MLVSLHKDDGQYQSVNLDHISFIDERKGDRGLKTFLLVSFASGRAIEVQYTHDNIVALGLKKK